MYVSLFVLSYCHSCTCMYLCLYSLIVIYVCIFVCTLLFQFLTKKLNVSTVTYGYLETVSSVAMLISGPFFGRFGDRFGAKSAMILCFIGSFFFYFFLTITDDVLDLFLSRLGAFLMHAFHGKNNNICLYVNFLNLFFSLASQMVMTDVSGTRGAVCLHI